MGTTTADSDVGFMLCSTVAPDVRPNMLSIAHNGLAMPHRPPPDPLRVSLQPHWRLDRGGDDALDATALLDLLATVQGTGSIAQAGRELGLSYWYVPAHAAERFAPVMRAVRGRVRPDPSARVGGTVSP